MGCRILAGMVYVRDLSVAQQPLLPIGNAQASLAVAQTKVDLPDYTSPAGGNACSVTDISGVELTLTMYDFKPANIALAVFGNANVGAGASVIGEVVEGYTNGAINPLAHIPVAATLVVKIGATTYVLNTDYVAKGAGYIVLAGSALETAILAGAGTPKHVTTQVTYTWAADLTVEALVTSGKTFELLIDGQNKANNNSDEVWRLFKVQFGPTGGLNIITRDFGSMDIKGQVIADITKAPGLSQYFTVKAPS